MKVMLLSSAINNGSFNPNATYSNANGTALTTLKSMTGLLMKVSRQAEPCHLLKASLIQVTF